MQRCQISLIELLTEWALNIHKIQSIRLKSNSSRLAQQNSFFRISDLMILADDAALPDLPNSNLTNRIIKLLNNTGHFDINQQ